MTESKVFAIFSDAHGNAPCLKRAFDTAKELGATDFFYLGDSIGYIPSTEALELLMSFQGNLSCLLGNHEEKILSLRVGDIDDAVTQHGLILNLLKDAQMEFISKWPIQLSMVCEDYKMLFVHGSPQDPVNGYIYLDSHIDNETDSMGHDLIFMGNTHIPFIRKVGTKVFVNVGSVGLPRDHGKMGSFALINFRDLKLEIVRYPMADIQSQIKKRFSNQIHSDVYKIFDRVSPFDALEEIKID